MLERWITALHIEAAGTEEPAVTRERLKDRFPRGSTRRMTQLGLLVSNVLATVAPTENDTIVYASCDAETRALEGYLDSFPTASPTLFQTSIHPSAVQQALILRQQAVRQFFPMTGDTCLPAQALTVALLAETPRTILCGGEERSTWLRERGLASATSFAFALVLSTSPVDAIGRLTLSTNVDASDSDSGSDSSLSALDSRLGGAAAAAAAASLTLPDFFDLLQTRLAFDAPISPLQHLTITWS